MLFEFLMPCGLYDNLEEAKDFGARKFPRLVPPG